MNPLPKNWVVLAAILMFFCLVATASPAAQPQATNDGCMPYYDRPVPKFHVGRQYRITAGTGGLVIDISMAPADFDKDKVLAVVCRIARVHPNEAGLFVHVFDSERAAKRYNPTGGNDKQTTFSYRAVYDYADTRHLEQAFSWRPDPQDLTRWVPVDLGVHAKP